MPHRVARAVRHTGAAAANESRHVAGSSDEESVSVDVDATRTTGVAEVEEDPSDNQDEASQEDGDDSSDHDSDQDQGQGRQDNNTDGEMGPAGETNSEEEPPVSPPVAQRRRQEQSTPTCRRCGKTFLQESACRTHMNDTHVGRMCYWPACYGGVFDNEEQLRLHFRVHQQVAVEQHGQDPTVCPWPGCGKQFSRAHTVQRCIKAHNRAAPRGV